MPGEPPSGRDLRVAQWAADHRQIGSKASFAQRLDGEQVSVELLEIFRETPEFGRSLAARLEPFHVESTGGALNLIGGGGEAIVFGDTEQQAIKLFAPPGKAAFGWVLEQDAMGCWGIRGGGLAAAMERFAWFESFFDTGLEIDQIGEAADFLVLRQPFIAGHHPDETALHAWMADQGWEPWSPASDLAMIVNQSWRRGSWAATDVRPENALLAEADGRVHAIDFIVGKIP